MVGCPNLHLRGLKMNGVRINFPSSKKKIIQKRSLSFLLYDKTIDCYFLTVILVFKNNIQTQNLRPFCETICVKSLLTSALSVMISTVNFSLKRYLVRGNTILHNYHPGEWVLYHSRLT